MDSLLLVDVMVSLPVLQTKNTNVLANDHRSKFIEMSKQEMKTDVIMLLLSQILHKKYNKNMMKLEQVKICLSI